MRLLLLAVLLLSSARRLPAASVAPDLACPDNVPCYCMPAEDNQHEVHCATGVTDGASAFNVSLRVSKSVRIRCLDSPDWLDFFLDASLRMGKVRNWRFLECKLPGPNFIDGVVGRFGIREVEFLAVGKLRGNVSREDLEVFPQLTRLVLNGIRLGSVPADFLYGLPNLNQLELRGTRIKLPATGFFRKSQSLVSLELAQNDLHDLEPGVFNGLDNLLLLNLWSCNISTLQSGLFQGLPSLGSLDIKQNQLRELPADIFHGLPNLGIIDISFNSFSELPADLFAHNRRLVDVKLMHNRANMTRLPDGFFSGFAELKVVSLERIGLLNVSENLFWESGAIVELNMNGNYLTTLPVDLLRDARKLEKLSLSSNSLRALPDGIFKNQQKLVTLDLSMNHLSTINEYLFASLDTLRELNVAHNDLKFIEPKALVPLRNLRVAEFSYNQLNLRTDLFANYGRVSLFHKCESLDELYLSHNNVTEMFSDWTFQLSRLRELDLSYNAIENLQAENLQFASDKVLVNLTHNKISSVDLSRLESISGEQRTRRDVVVDLNFNPIHCDCDMYSLLRYTNKEMHFRAYDFLTLQLQNLTCHGPDYMRDKKLLGLKASELKCAFVNVETTASDPCASNGVCDCWLRPDDRTVIVDCASRNLTEAPAMIKDYNVERVEVDLSGNRLRTAPNLTGNGYERVLSLNLSGNLIDHIRESLVSPDVEILHLNGNQLRCIDAKVLHKIDNDSSIGQLTLRDNPWACDCASEAFMHFARTDRRLVSDLDNVTCVQNNLPTSLYPSPVYLFIVAFALNFLLFLALFVCYRIWLNSRNTGSELVEQEELDSIKVWDAFIVYAHQDEAFVREELASEFERHSLKSLKFCIDGSNDCIPRILSGIEESKETFIVLSPDFIESSYNRLIFQVAHKKTLSVKGTRVGVILYGDIDREKITDPYIQRYLQTYATLR